MAQTNIIDVEVFPSDGGESIAFKGDKAVNYISFVTDGTFGIPALLSESKLKDEGLPARVLYINPGNVSAVEATRRA